MLGKKVSFSLSDTKIEGTLEQSREDEIRGTVYLVDVTTVDGEIQKLKTVVSVTKDTLNQYGDYIE